MSFAGSHWGSNLSSLSIFLGVQDGPDPAFIDLYTCAPVAGSLLTVGDASNVSCVVPRGVGSRLRFTVRVGLLRSLPSADTLSYPPPFIVPHTLRHSLDGVYLSPFYGFLSSGDQIFFDAKFVGNVSSRMLVLLGHPGQTHTLGCAVIALYQNETDPDYVSIQCTVAPGSGKNFTLVVSLLGGNVLTPESDDVYNFFVAPTIASISGCPVNDPMLGTTAGGYDGQCVQCSPSL